MNLSVEEDVRIKDEVKRNETDLGSKKNMATNSEEMNPVDLEAGQSSMSLAATHHDHHPHGNH